MSEESRLVDIYTHLMDKGFDVYFPTQKTGECTEPYLVVKDSGTTQYQDFSSTLTIFEVLCYVPQNNYSRLQTYMEEVKEAMKELEPMIRPMYYQSAPFYDSVVNAHMSTIQYKNFRKIN